MAWIETREKGRRGEGERGEGRREKGEGRREKGEGRRVWQGHYGDSFGKQRKSDARVTKDTGKTTVPCRIGLL
jgi:hypothetical protein